jgi:hypothetical protein
MHGLSKDLRILLTLSPISRAMSIESSIYTSTFPISLVGNDTDKGFASWNLISSGRLRDKSRDKERLSNRMLWSQKMLCIRVLHVSEM